MAKPSEESFSKSNEREQVALSLERWLLSGILFLSGIGFIAYGQFWWTKKYLPGGWPWMILGIVLIGAACWRFPYFPTPAPRRPLSWLERGFLLLLVVGGGMIRFVALDRFPPGGFFDEVQNYLVAEDILKGSRPIYITEMTQMPALFFYLLAGPVALVDKSLEAVRGFSAFLGTLTLPAFYLLAREFFVRQVAAIVALLLVGSRWHITFSRIGFTGIISPLLEVLTILCLVRAFRTRWWGYYLGVGLLVGIGLQTYYAFNLFLLVLIVVVLSYAGCQGLRQFWPELRRILIGLTGSILIAGILLIPLIGFALQNPQAFFHRAGTVAIWNPAHNLPLPWWPDTLWMHIKQHLLMFNYEGDYNPRHNIPFAPMLTSIEGILLAVGLGCVLSRGLVWPQAIWFAWFVMMLLPGILTIESPQAYRTIGVIPVLYLIIGEGLQMLYHLVTGRVEQKQTQKGWFPSFLQGKAFRARFLILMLLGVTLIAMWANIHRYFRIQVWNPQAWQAFDANSHEVARFLQSQELQYTIWSTPLYFGTNVLRFHLSNNFPYRPFFLSEHLPLSVEQFPPQSKGTLYVLETFQKDLFPLFQALYPLARMEEHLDPFGQVMFVHITIPREDYQAPFAPEIDQKGFLAAFYPNEKWEGEPTRFKRDPAIFFHFHWPTEALPDPFTADWTTYLKIEQAGEYKFQLMSSGPALVLINGKVVITESAFDRPVLRQGSISLKEGKYLLVVRYLERSFASTIRLWWQPPGRDLSIPPLYLLNSLTQEEYRRLRENLPRPRTK